MSKYKHLVFYDGSCGLCDRIVQWLLKVDIEEHFIFAPLQGKTAAVYLQDLPDEFKGVDSLVLIEDYRTNRPRIYVLAKAALRIMWLLGGSWMIIGSLFFLPACLFNWAYRLVACNRHRFFSQDQCVLPQSGDKDRFLP